MSLESINDELSDVVTGKREGQITCQVKNYREHVNALRNLVERLEECLVNALREHEPPKPLEASKAAPLVGMAMEISEINGLFADSLTHLSDVMERLEL